MSKRERDCNLDILKAIAIVCVLLWHLQPFRLPASTSTDSLSYLALNFFNKNITLIAVPLFYLISSLLFFKNLKAKANYISQRVTRILVLYLFWSLFQIIVFYITFFVFDSVQWQWPVKTQSIWDFIVMGGPSLPVVGDSVFYFLFNLLLLSCITWMYSKIKGEWRFKLSCVLVGFYCFYCTVNSSIPYWRIDNFLVYIPLADICLKRQSVLFFVIALALFSLALIYEYSQHHNYSIYARNSILFGTLSLYLGVNLLNFKSIPKGIKLLSLYSLGLFSLHKYWMMVFVILLSLGFDFLHINPGLVFATDSFLILPFLEAGLAALATILTVFMMSKSNYLCRYVK